MSHSERGPQPAPEPERTREPENLQPPELPQDEADSTGQPDSSFVGAETDSSVRPQSHSEEAIDTAVSLIRRRYQWYLETIQEYQRVIENLGKYGHKDVEVTLGPFKQHLTDRAGGLEEAMAILENRELGEKPWWLKVEEADFPPGKSHG